MSYWKLLPPRQRWNKMGRIENEVIGKMSVTSLLLGSDAHYDAILTAQTEEEARIHHRRAVMLRREFDRRIKDSLAKVKINKLI